MRSRLAVALGAASLTIGGLALAAVGAAPAGATATPQVTSQPYTIGTGSVISPAVTESSTTVSATKVQYTLSFVTPVALNQLTSSITINDPSGQTTFPTTSTDYTIVDLGTSPYVEGTNPSVTAYTVSGANSGVTLTLAASDTASTSIKAGDTVEVIITGVTNPSTAGSYSLQVWTSQDPVPASTATYSITGVSTPACSGTSSTPPTPSPTTGTFVSAAGSATVDPLAGAANQTYCLQLSFTSGSSAVSLNQISIGIPGALFPAVPTDYTVLGEVAPATTTSALTVSSVSISGNDTSSATVTLTLSAPVPVGANTTATFDVGMNGVTNPTAQTSGATPTTGSAFTVPATANFLNNGVAQTGTPKVAVPSNGFTFSEAPASVSVAVNPQTGGSSAILTYTFQLTTELPSSGTITLVAPANTTFPSSPNQYLWSGNGQMGIFTGSPQVNPGQGPAANLEGATFPLSDLPGSQTSLLAGQTFTVTVIGVTNPVAGTYSTAGTTGYYGVVTSQDLAIAAAPAVTLAATSTTGQFTVTVNPNTPAATGVTYMTGPFSASTAFAAGSQIEIEAPTGTTFPSVPSDYELYDLSTPSSTQQPSAVAIDGTANDMILTLASPLNAGDNLKLVVNDVTNPPAGVYTLSLGAVTTGDALSLFTTLPATPNAGVTYPNGAIVRNPNGAEYIFAGGKAFPITSPAVGHAIYEADHGHVPSVVQLSSALPASVITGPARPGTLLQVAGKAPIYVVGTNGTSVYSFTSPSNFLGDGYDPNNVVEISALTTSTTGGCCTYTPGTAPTAAQTMADGALLRTKAGGVYLVEGGTAFPVTNGSLLKTIQKVDPAQVLQNITITATNTNQPTANGTLLQQIGTKGVYVSYQGVLYPLPSPKELTSDGYTFQMVVMVPSLGPNPTAPAGVS